MEWLDKFDLKTRQRSFVLAYLGSGNTAEAAETAGDAQTSVQGPRMLGNVRIAETVTTGRGRVN